MKTFKILALALTVLFIGITTVFAKEGKNTSNLKTIRLVYPQWQGGNIAALVPELSPEDVSRGYFLGANLLNYLAPETKNKTLTVPISQNINRAEENGILGYKEIAEQTKAALEILEKENPDRILTLGGECSASVVPFTYLEKKYNNDVAMIWIDAHPDITLPQDKTYNGYHAMAAAAVMGKWKDGITGQLPAKINTDKVLFVGLRDWERQQIKDRQSEYGIKHLSVEETRNDSTKVLEWLKSTGAKHVVIHFDMDVLDPNEIIAAVGVVPDGMKIAEVIRVINDIAKEYDIVGLTVAEPMPRTAIKLKNMLQQLPMME